MPELVVFTNNFPFGDGEAFLETEILFLSKSFKSIHLFPLYYGNKQRVRSLPENVTFSTPFFKKDIVADRFRLLVSGLFNTSPIRFFISELVQSKACTNYFRFKNWLGATCITRSLLKKTSFRNISAEIENNTVIYFYWGDKSSGIVPFLSKKRTNPILVRFHGTDLYEEQKKGYISFRKSLLRHLSVAVFISKTGENYLKGRYPKIKFRTKVSRLGVKKMEPAKQSTDNVLRVASCSYVVPVKRIHLIADALNLLNFKVEWTHLGDGPMLNQVMEQCKSLKPNIRAKFYGQVSNEEVIKFYKNSPVDLFLNVSESEGIPVSIMEAIAAGIPVIATDVGGTSEIVNEKFGQLIPKDFTIGYLAEKIETFNTKSFNEKTEMRKQAKLFWATHYNAELNYQEFATFVRDLQK